MPWPFIAGPVFALVVYAVATSVARRPALTPLDFLAATSPGYLGLQAALAVFVLALVVPYRTISVRDAVLGYAVGVVFVIAPYAVGIARRESFHQFEVRDLYPRGTIVRREALLCAIAVPVIAACEESAVRGVVRVPEAVVFVVQWLLYAAGSRSRATRALLPCALLALLHQRTGSLGLVIGAHAAIQTLGGRLRSPGIFGDVYDLLAQAQWRDLGPRWMRVAVELAVGAAVVALVV